MNPYATLGVDRNADADAIRKAYKSLAKKFHPDINKDPKAEARFKEINAAYEAIGDPEARKLFDEFGEAATKPGFQPEEARRWRQAASGRSSGMGFDFGGGGVDMEDMLGSLFGAGLGGGAARQRRGADRQAELSLDFLTAVLGAERELQLRRADGGVESIKVRIPAGARDGGRLKLKGHGLPPRGGGPAGDLHITLHIEPHPLLRRIDDDLELDIPLTIEEAVCGATILVPTPTGDVRVTIPAGAASGQRLRLKGRGVQRATPGDLYLVLRPTVPQTQDPELREAAQRLTRGYTEDVRGQLRI